MSVAPTGDPSVRGRRRVLILWAQRKAIAEALKANLITHFEEQCDFEILTDFVAGPNYIDVSSAAIDRAHQILILVAAKDWTNAPYLKGEIAQIFTQIKLKKRSQTCVAFVKYQDEQLPAFAMGFFPLYFSDGQTLSKAEIDAFQRWLSQSACPMLVLREEVLQRPEGDYLLLNWLLGFDDTLWGFLPSDPPLDAARCKDGILQKIRLLKALHSVHAAPGPHLGRLVDLFVKNVSSARRRRIDVKALRSSLAGIIGIGQAAASEFRPVQQLVRTGLLPVITALVTRLGEIGMAESAREFSSDLLSRLESIVTPGEPFRSGLSDWIDGLGACLDLVTGNESGVFLDPKEARLWSDHPDDPRSRVLEDVRELYVRSVLLAAAVVVFFDLLKVQNLHLEEEPHTDVAKVLMFFADTSVRLCPVGFIDPVVKMSNRIILHYIEAADKLTVAP